MTKEERKALSFRSRVHHGIKKRIKNNSRSIRIDVRKQLRLIAREESVYNSKKRQSNFCGMYRWISL